MTSLVYLDEAGLVARFGGPLPPGTLVRRNPGDPSCQECLESPDGYCREHPEYWTVPAEVTAEEGAA